MKFSKLVLSFLSLFFFSLMVYPQSPFDVPGYSMGKSGIKGSMDSHFYAGIGFSNFSDNYLPTTQILDPSYDNLFLSGDFYFGLGYYITNNISLGAEMGFSFNTLDSTGYSNPYYLEAGYLPILDSFWSWMTPAWLSAYGYNEETPVKMLVEYYEIPIRFYIKFSSLGSSIRWIALEAFTGIDLTFTHVQTYFYKAYPTGSNHLFFSQKVSQTYFSPNFTAGARLTLAFIGFEYSYHLPIGQYIQGFNYYHNIEHRISVGFSINMVS